MESKRMGGMKSGGEFFNNAFRGNAEKTKGKSCLPIGCAGIVVLCASIVEMARLMDFTSLQSYINAFIKLFGK